MWKDTRGAFHMLVHRFAGTNGSTAGVDVGGHAWSADGLRWSYDCDEVAYTSVVTWRNGTGGSTLYRRERPKPLVDVGGRITHLFNGGWPCHVGAEDDDSQDAAAGCWTYTLVTKVLR